MLRSVSLSAPALSQSERSVLVSLVRSDDDGEGEGGVGGVWFIASSSWDSRWRFFLIIRENVSSWMLHSSAIIFRSTERSERANWLKLIGSFLMERETFLQRNQHQHSGNNEIFYKCSPSAVQKPWNTSRSAVISHKYLIILSYYLLI